MPAFSVKLARLYQIDLAQAKIEQTSWDEQPIQNKLRKFFLGTAGRDWEAYVESVKCSTGGAKGVFFLNLKERRLGQGLAAPLLASAMCAMKATDAPQQTLFAEYILQDLGNAKIPKSLIIKLDWAEYKKQNYDTLTSNWQGLNPAATTTDDGLKLLWVIMTKQDTQLTSAAQAKYNRLRTELFTNKPRYFVLMKGVRVDDELDFAVRKNNTTQEWELNLVPAAVANFSPFLHKMVDPFNLPKGSTNRAYRLSDFDTLERALSDWWSDATKIIGFNRTGLTPSTPLTQLRLTPGQALPKWYAICAQNNEKFGKVLTRIFLNKRILANPDLMKKAGRILAIDTLIGNTDRFEGGNNGMNIGNAFFYSKKYQARQQKSKAPNPIAVIDNEAMLTIFDLYTPEGLLGTTDAGVQLDSTNPKHASSLAPFGNTYHERLLTRYLAWVFDLGYSDLVNGMGTGVFRYPNLFELFSNFDDYIAAQLGAPLLSPTVPLINDIYADDGTIAPGITGAYSPFSARPTNQGIVDPTWVSVISNIKAGFLEGMEAILSLDLDRYRGMYARLLGLYGAASHFDFAAFEMRLMYITEGPDWQRDPATRRLVGFRHDTTRHTNVIAKIRRDYLGKTNATKTAIEKVLTTAETNQEISQEDRRLAVEQLRLTFGCA